LLLSRATMELPKGFGFFHLLIHLN